MNGISGQRARGFLLAAVLVAAVTAVHAQTPNPPQGAAPSPAVKPPADAMAVPGFWDPRRRPERPDLSRINIIRFLTETDYPPFNYAGPDGVPAGFNVELARQICEEIKVQCTVQMRRFDTLIDALNANQGDAVIASLAETPEMRRRVDFTDPYYRTPARFVSRKDAASTTSRRKRWKGKRSRWSPAPPMRPICARCSLRSSYTHIRMPMPRVPRCVAARSTFYSATALRSLSGSTALIPAAAACSAAGRISKAVFSARASALRSAAATNCCGRLSTGRCSSCGRKGDFTDLWLRYFPISPF